VRNSLLKSRLRKQKEKKLVFENKSMDIKAEEKRGKILGKKQPQKNVE